ncbi:restriction endonuclease subunit S [Streptococcus suis]|uniref:Type I restriction modification DNA specificity domain-containing protein n=1 Tax=Streptococcus suis TaxID=1307 RepID=A0AB37GAR3_STRSU|nr:restriction endonuclease subunit S [Streptococcus suis]MBS8096036.1 restriction endonuclease subunit S [Streptococcus suis]MCB2893222.1 restriction endonuclease subunit S [Streptococcus suis]MCB2918056.1 restriction endonuclease subunit S [Streptococcus suis]MCB2939331.1 restriction endonuclease subunit S [Streptococcus suis]MCL4902406.1 restriction endonuclease subunit S [Streptococcus suis]
MTKEKSTVPRLRFPGFTDAWKQRKAMEIFKFVSDKGYADLPILSASQELGMIRRDEIGIDIKYDKEAVANYKRVLPGQFVIHLRSFQGGFAWSEIEGLTSPAYTILDFKEENSSKFWRNVLTSPNFIKKLETVTYGIRDGRSISYSDFSTLNFVIPTLPEQEAIGSFFSDLDQLITLHQRKLDDVKELKKALLQKMFPKGNGNDFPELRFPEFTDAWKQRKLGEVAEKISQKNLDRQYVETFTNSAEFGIISQRDFFEKNISSLDNISGYYIVNPDDFVYNPRISNLAPVGPIKRNKLGRVGVMSPLYTIFRFSDIHLDFVEKYFDTTIWHRYMELNGDSGARSDRFAIKDSVFKGLPIPLPTLPEQEAIGSFFSDLDQLITLHQRQLDHLKLLKKALLQQMFI